MRLRHEISDERGTVLVLAMAGVALVIAVALVMLDVSSLFMRRNALMMVADDAAIAAANAIDVDAIYAGGVGVMLRLDPIVARQLAQASIARLSDERLRDVRVDAVYVDQDTVEVVLSAAVPSPLSGITGNRSLRIHVRASAVTPTRF